MSRLAALIRRSGLPAVHHAAAVMMFACAFASPALGQDEAEAPGSTARIIDVDPYDQLHLKDGSLVKVLPLPFPDRHVPENPRPSDKLTLRLADNPAKQYEVFWRDITSVDLFEAMVLAETERLIAEKQFDEAFDYVDFLEGVYPQYPGVGQVVGRFLFEDAKGWQQKKQYDYALALLNELYARDRDFAGLAKAMGSVTGRLIEAQLAKNDPYSAQRLLAEFAAKFPQDEVVAKWTNEFNSQAEALLDQARQELAANHLREASQRARQAVAAWPKLEAARDFATELHARYPTVNVGVLAPFPMRRADWADAWAYGRGRRLAERTLWELVAAGPEGGEYRTPLGTAERADLGQRLLLRIDPSLRWTGTELPVTGYDVSRHLLAMADPATGVYRADWAAVMRGVAVDEVYGVQIDLAREHVHPEALFETGILPWRHQRQPDAAEFYLGAYRAERLGDAASVFVLADLAAAAEGQPREIVERLMPNSTAAIEALRRGDVAVLDRVPPWQLPLLREDAAVVVAPYVIPSVHVLVPRGKHPLLGERNFRRALLYGLHREAILNVQLLRGNELPGCRVTSGPFATGYAFNERVETTAYEPRLALTLARLSLELKQAEKADLASAIADKEVPQGEPAPANQPATAAPFDAPAAAPSPAAEAPAKSAGEPKPLVIPRLVIAHPSTEVAVLACRSIKKQWELLKIPVELVEFAPHTPVDELPEHDLLYLELQWGEPAVDVGRFFGPGGLVPDINAYLRAALDRLALAGDWRSARETLLEIHRLVAEDCVVLPLWQLTEHFAHRRELQGIPPRPVSLYQSIEQWRTAAFYLNP